jgi:hypothetical protein
VESIRAGTANAAKPTYSVSGSGQMFDKFNVTTPEQIVKLLSTSTNKYCALDPVPTTIVKQSADLIAVFISELLNRSLAEGYVPSSQKIAFINPHLKKHGLDTLDNKNYRPVSNLPFLSKLLERVVAGQLNEFLQQTKSLPLSQSAYRKFHSTETALLKVFSDLCRAIDDGNTCLLGLLDLSSAFDTVDHEILLSRLEITFGFNGLVLQWLKSYLTGRTQVVRIAGCCSEPSALCSGVPQGSILGPLLFILYTAPVLEIINKHGLSGHCYADDTQIQFYCAPSQMFQLAGVFSNCIAELENWMAMNRLKLNSDKTEFIWMASRGRLRALQNVVPTVSVGGTVITSSAGARNLGVFFDQHLDMRKHITNVCRQCYYQLRQLRVICHNLPKDVLKTLLHAFVSTRLDYCNALFYGLPKSDIRKLQSVQNAAARLIGGLRKYDHITSLMRDQLHWLPISFRIDYKIAVLTYKALHHQSPDYVTAMCCLAADSSSINGHRSASNGDLIPVPWNSVFYGKRSYYYAAPEVWNKIPVHIRKEPTFSTFSKQLKTVLFRHAYHS